MCGDVTKVVFFQRLCASVVANASAGGWELITVSGMELGLYLVDTMPLKHKKGVVVFVLNPRSVVS